MVADNDISSHIARYAASNARDAKANLLQRPGQQTVHLETPAAPLRQHQLVEDRSDVEPHRAPELHIQVFVGNGGEVTSMQAAQRIQIGSRLTAEPDSTQVGLQSQVS